MALEAIEAVAITVLAAALALLALAVRQRVLSRGGGTVELSLRLRTRVPGRGWMLGLGRFDGDVLQWYRVFSLSVRPRRTLSRRDLTVQVRRNPAGPERLALPSGAMVMECASTDGPLQLAMGPSAVTGFLAWLEAAPPGATLPG